MLIARLALQGMQYKQILYGCVVMMHLWNDPWFTLSLDCEAVLVFKSFCAKNIPGCWCGEACLPSKISSNELPPTNSNPLSSFVLFYQR